MFTYLYSLFHSVIYNSVVSTNEASSLYWSLSNISYYGDTNVFNLWGVDKNVLKSWDGDNKCFLSGGGHNCFSFGVWIKLLFTVCWGGNEKCFKSATVVLLYCKLQYCSICCFFCSLHVGQNGAKAEHFFKHYLHTKKLNHEQEKKVFGLKCPTTV